MSNSASYGSAVRRRAERQDDTWTDRRAMMPDMTEAGTTTVTARVAPAIRERQAVSVDA
jgi:hypothetical protein